MWPGSIGSSIFFGGLLIFTAIKLMLEKEGEDVQPRGDNAVLKLIQTLVIPLTPFMATLVVIESSDLFVCHGFHPCRARHFKGSVYRFYV